MSITRLWIPKSSHLAVIFLLIASITWIPNQSVHAASTYIVDRADDVSGLACTGAANDCSLRSALQHAGPGDTILFASDFTITLTSALPDLSQTGLTINGDGHLVKINANDTGNVFKFTGERVTVEYLTLYGSAYRASNVWVTGGAKNDYIVSNTIGSDSVNLSGCSGVSKHTHSGVYVDSTATLSGDEFRAWIYGNVIECNGVDPADPDAAYDFLNPGDGVYIHAVDGVRLGFQEPNSPYQMPITMNHHNGVTIDGSASNNIVANSIISMNHNSGIYINDASHNQIYSSTVMANLNTGIELWNGAQNNQIGCPIGGPTSYRNYVNGNHREGIYIDGSTTLLNLILCNYIGVGSDGSSAAGNFLNGVVIKNAALLNNIGTSTADGNVISGNGAYGVTIEDGAYTNIVEGNRIGTNAAGTAALANGWDGVNIYNSYNCRVGGDTPENANQISGNHGSGVRITGAISGANKISMNNIGLNADETAAIPNGGAGIALVGAGTGITIGHTSGPGHQVIAGNLREGIYIEATRATTINRSNDIGLPGLGNVREGVKILNADHISLMADSIRDNGLAGISVEGDASLQDWFEPGEDYGNGGLPIDLGNDGPTQNLPSHGTSGPNLLQPYPTVTSLVSGAIQGTTCAGCGVIVYHAIGDPGKPGGGGTIIATIRADAGGTWTGVIPVSETAGRISIVAMDSNDPPNTSEFSPRPLLYLPNVRR